MSAEISDQELENIFGDVDEGMPVPSDNVAQAAQALAGEMGQPPMQAIPQTAAPQQIQQIQTVAPPPSEPVKTEEDRVMDKYNEEKSKLLEVESQLLSLSHSDKSGSIIRNFGLSQAILQIGDEVDRVNGLVLLRSLKARCKSVSRVKDSDNQTQSTQVTEQETLANCMYEVWGVMEDGSVGLTSSYAPSLVVSVISLRSGYDMPPPIPEED